MTHTRKGGGEWQSQRENLPFSPQKDWLAHEDSLDHKKDKLANKISSNSFQKQEKFEAFSTTAVEAIYQRLNKRAGVLYMCRCQLIVEL